MREAMGEVVLRPIGRVRSRASSVPRHWSVSDVEGELLVDPEFEPGLAGVEAGRKIVVLFVFHRSPAFSPGLLQQIPSGGGRARGVFTICSPRRPNPIGMSVLDVLAVEGNVLRVKGLDMFDGTPILDIKPHITG
jgi:tRNA-Thr(GGU) m(6)t(6)A37 methyltransferase TsaA